MLISRKNPLKANNTSWKPGISGNAKGRPATGLQGFKDRLSHWIETKTLKEIKALVDDPDEKKLDKMYAADVMVVQRVRAACKQSGGADFQMILDRLLGKPAITGDLQVTHALADRLDSAEKLLATDAAFEIIDEESSPPMLTAPIEADDFSDLI